MLRRGHYSSSVAMGSSDLLEMKCSSHLLVVVGDADVAAHVAGQPADPDASADDASSGPPSLVSTSPASTPRRGTADTAAIWVTGDGAVIHGGTRLAASLAVVDADAAMEPPPQPQPHAPSQPEDFEAQDEDAEPQLQTQAPAQAAGAGTGAGAGRDGNIDTLDRVWLMSRDGTDVWFDDNVRRWRGRRGRFSRGPAPPAVAYEPDGKEVWFDENVSRWRDRRGRFSRGPAWAICAM